VPSSSRKSTGRDAAPRGDAALPPLSGAAPPAASNGAGSTRVGEPAAEESSASPVVVLAIAKHPSVNAKGHRLLIQRRQKGMLAKTCARLRGRARCPSAPPEDAKTWAILMFGRARGAHGVRALPTKPVGRQERDGASGRGPHQAAGKNEQSRFIELIINCAPCLVKPRVPSKGAWQNNASR
jgi:hypothetical protein